LAGLPLRSRWFGTGHVNARSCIQNAVQDKGTKRERQ
jgi:hypothetical protein